MHDFTITLIRHGETDYNKKRIIQGQMDTDLSEKGVKQAELCGQRLQKKKFTQTYCSDLKRAIMTAENILKYNQVTKCPLKRDIRLRERNFGEYEGRPCDEFMALLQTSNVKHVQDFAPPRGESLREVRARAVEWFNEVCQSIRDQQQSPKQQQSNHGNHISASTYSDCSSSSNSEVIDGNGSAACNHRTYESNAGAEVLDMLDVLVVSHGGFLKELIAYFCEELGAVLPGGMKAMTKTPYNTALSKFSVGLNADGQASMTCLVLNDRDHLLQSDIHQAVKVDEI